MKIALAGTALSAVALAVTPALAADPTAWDRARAQLVAQGPSSLTYAIDRWKTLTSSDRFSFSDYAGFMISYPDFPDEDKLRRYAEGALEREYVEPSRVVAYFDVEPPLTNPGRAQYAMALQRLGRPEAAAVAKAAWRGGPMNDTAEAVLFSSFGQTFTMDDHDARMDALLWAGSQAAAERQLGFVSAGQRAVDSARLALLSGTSVNLVSPAGLMNDPGYVYQRARTDRRNGSTSSARNLLANRPQLSRLPLDPDKWVEELLVNARGAASDGDPRTAVKIAQSVDDTFKPGEDISAKSLGLRDDYTSLVWLGGTEALWDLRDPQTAAPLFFRYGNAARTPPTRSKGFYWAGYAAARAGDATGANRYFEMAGEYQGQFYGQLALERLGRPITPFPADSTVQPTPQQRAAFNATPLTQAVREVAKATDWRTTVRFFRQVADNAQSEADHVMVADLARDIGRRDLAVILGNSAAGKGFANFQRVSNPTVTVPPGFDANWSMIHAISRQESQFAQNAVSHAGARGLMQLMPGTAREQAGKMGLSYAQSYLIDDPDYNIRLGSGYFSRMMDYYGGSYPLAVAAYNAGPGNVNKFIRANGDPRTGSIEWVEWIEKIPIYETKNYVQRVLENAVVYEAMNPQRASYRGTNPTSHFLGKRSPG